MGTKYKALRKQLDDLGYKQVLSPDSVSLVERLVSDLIQTTDGLKKYMTIAKQAIEERDNLELGAEPYKCDNAKLVKECNELHLTFLQYREQNEKLHKNLKRRITELEAEINESNLEQQKLRRHIQELENKSRIGRKPVKTVSTSALTKHKSPLKSKASFESSSTMALADKKITNLSKEIKKLKDEQLQLLEATESYKNQICSRDREIMRLNTLLQGGRPPDAINKDCCYKDTEGKLGRMQDEINTLKREKMILEDRLKESVAKQHEAMKRALHLAERNKQLEKELRDIDQMALAVEAEANCCNKTNYEKINRLQDRMHENLLQLQCLEKEAADLRREKHELFSDLEAVKMEKKHLQVVLETALEEKKHMTDRINQFTIIEHDLNLEIDRLVQASAEQKRKIAELECRVLSSKLDLDYPEEMQDHGKSKSPTRSPTRKSTKQTSRLMETSPNASPKKTARKKPPTHSKPPQSSRPRSKSPKHKMDSRKDVATAIDSNRYSSEYSDGRDALKHGACRCCNSHSCVEMLKQLFDREMDQRKLQTATENLEKVRCEKDYYMKEYQRLVEQLKHVPSKPDSDPEMLKNLNEKEQKILSLQRELNEKLNEKEQEISRLQQDNRNLSQEKYNLMSRLETARDRPDTEMESLSLRSTVKRLERERELLRGDVQRLEEERDAIRQRLKVITESQVSEHAKLEKALSESEEQVRRLEQERRELMQTQGSRRATINNLEEQCECMREQYRTAQAELNHQRTIYGQLKALHEQTDRALADSQGQIRQLEGELTNAQDRIRALDKDRGSVDQEVHVLKQDIITLKGSLAQLDQEKDALLIALDDKTEKMAALDQDLKMRNKTILDLESKITELRQQLSLTADSSSSREHLLKAATSENANLKRELEATQQMKDNALIENRRLQDELASCKMDCRKINNELEIARRQIEDLKTQLQQYVAEVKRAEDLISQKELERSELLDQFRALSQEATVLENSNHSLENAATQSKVQLSVALEHAMDLERQIETKDTMIKGYEREIKDLTSHIASLEMQLKQQKAQQENMERELAAMNELCVKLDQQKDNLSREVDERESRRAQMTREVERLRRESETVQSTLSRDRGNVQQLEKLLAETRREAVEQKLLNEELQSEIQRLRTKCEEYQGALISTTEQLDIYQEKALDYSQQNKQLRREIANERFFRSSADDSKRYPSL